VAAPDLPLLTFADAAAFEAWLRAQPLDAMGGWLRFAKAGAPEPTLRKSDAIDSALAHGWIDGQVGTVDAHFCKARFTPRRPRSRWSLINCERVERLVAAGRMAPAGLREVEAARADGRWEAAYPPASRAAAPPDLLLALEARPAARALWTELDGANRYAVLHRVHVASAAARAGVVARLAAMLERGETVHPRRVRR
jgi:uncharacterized protein YdeI (YjbR/CyaY-like superfamily)